MLRTIARLAAALLFAASTCCHADANVGEAAPDVVLGVTQTGNSVRVSDHPGKVVVVSFWASWCAPCRKELAILEGLQVEGKGSLQVIAVNIEDRELFKKAAQLLGEMHVLLVNDRNERSQKAYGVKAIPHMVIVGKDGRILGAHKGYGEDALAGIVDEINRALAPASANSEHLEKP
ncbi:TlpA disulfide reductase family protein [Rudaea sp.]|uniref:TlpA family protein disulfide reductase n=1 Tax=Rudaea sp. TaxID=2136325 RepID=UPI002ED1A447